MNILPSDGEITWTRLGFAAVGALVSLKFLQGTWIERVILFIGGTVAGGLGSSWVAKMTDIPPYFTCFLIGMLGMAILSRVMEIIRTGSLADLGQVFGGWFKSARGQEPKE